MIRPLSSSHEWVKYPAFYNVYPVHNEVSFAGGLQSRSADYGEMYIDDYYGRVFNGRGGQGVAQYGVTKNMGYYASFPSLEVVDELRVPYRRVPIYRAENLGVIQQVFEETKAVNNGYRMLLRGQTKTYMISREPSECMHFYGEGEVLEPSFLPSHLRHTLDPFFLKCMWQSQAALLFNHLAFVLGQSHGVEAGRAFLQKAEAFRHSPFFMLFALGIAQHYGLPSVGLDLTDRLDVACWFATRTLSTDASGKSTVGRASFGAEHAPTIFIFRCPPDAVFDYRHAKVDGLPDGRPDKQGAWFGHVGWGAASNQLGSYLVCGFRLEPEVANQIDPGLDTDLFPSRSGDPILDYFMSVRNNPKYEGEARRALQGVYHTDD